MSATGSAGPTGSYEARRVPGGFDAELRRLRAQVLLSWPQEARLLQWLGLRDGMDVIELGSGPGYVTQELRALLPAGTVTAVDSDPGMLDRAGALLEGGAGGRVRLVTGTVERLAFAEGSFDFAIGRFIFQHLHDPVAAARETLRVLKPGGRLAIIDIDGALWGIAQPTDPRVGLIHAKAGRFQANEGGDRLIGRRLWRILQRAGFADLRLEAFVYHSDELGIEAFAPQLDPGRLQRAADAGYITREEFALLQEAHRRFLASPDAYVLMVGLMACGSKPG